MTEANEEVRRTLADTLKYLENRYADQMTGLRDVDSKVTIRLTVLTGILGAVIVTIPALEDAPIGLRVLALLFVLALAACYARTLWLALSAIDVRMSIPGVEPGSFQTLARHQNLSSEILLRELVINYSDAIDENWRIIKKREQPGEALRWWLRATLIAAFITVSYLAVAYGVSMYCPSTPEASVAKDETSTPPATTNNETPGNQSPQAQATQPSILAKPQHIQLGRSQESAPREAQIVTIEAQPTDRRGSEGSE